MTTPPTLSKQFNSRLEEIGVLAEEFEQWASQLGASPKIVNMINLMLDELITNIVMHGYKNREDGIIEIQISHINDAFDITLRDRAPPFNLLDAPAVDTSLGVEEREIGHLGVFLVRKLADQLGYRWNGQCNEVHFVKKMSSGE